MVNRLLECKEIDVNVQDKVSGNVDFATSRLPQILALLFLDVVFNEKFCLMVNKKKCRMDTPH